MSDGGLLSRLAARAGGAPPAVRPRLPARFERRPGGDLSLEDVVDAAASVERSPAGHDERAMPSPAPDTPARARPAPVPARLAVPRRAPIPAYPSPRRAARTVLSAADHAAVHRAAVDHSAVDRSAMTAGVVPAALDPAESVSRLAAGPSDLGALEVVPTRPAAAPPVSVSGDRALTSPSDLGAGAEPVVRISIGRVEVRANLTAAPPPAAAKPAARRDDGTSLHDYLRGQASTR